MKEKSYVNRLVILTFNIVLVAFYVVAPVQLSYAHNKVVVVPLGGDEAPTLEPTSPVAKVDPSQTDYTLMASTTIDNITGLEWQREDDEVLRNWNEALDYCAGLTLDSKTDWRLPDIVELQSIVDYGQATSPIIDGVAFPNTNSRFYWSASSRASNSGLAWFVGFFNGVVGSDGKPKVSFVRCVR